MMAETASVAVQEPINGVDRAPRKKMPNSLIGQDFVYGGWHARHEPDEHRHGRRFHGNRLRYHPS